MTYQRRTGGGGASGGATDHGELTGLTDADHPIAAVSGLQEALDLKAPLASPALTGTPTAPTPAAADNDTSIATTAFVQTELGLFVPTAQAPLKRTVEAQSLSGTSLVQWGQPAPAVAGTAADGSDTEGKWRQVSTTTSINNVASVSGQLGEYPRRWEPSVVFVVKPVDTTSARIWIGLVSGVSTSDDPAANIAAFRYSTAADAGNGQWRAYTNDGSGGGTITDTGVPILTQRYALGIELTATEVVFRIDGVVVATHTTDLPAIDTQLFWIMKIETLAAAAKAIKFSRCTILIDG